MRWIDDMKHIPYDKYLHFLAGFIIAVLVSTVTEYPVFGLAAAVFAGFMKEMRDWGCYQGFDRMDMLATWAGGAVGCAFVVFVEFLE